MLRRFLVCAAALFLCSSLASAQMYAPGANVLIPGDSGGTAQNGCVISLVSGVPVCTIKVALQASSVVINGGSSPTVAAGAGAGTSPTLTIAGAENSQAISLTTTCTVSCTGSSVIMTVTLPLTCPTQATPTITPANINAAQLSASGSVYIGAPATNSYTINSSSTGLVASTLYKWNVHVDCW